MKGEEKHSVFDLTSKVIDFSVITEENGDPTTLVILAEEELVLVDLTTETWPVMLFQTYKKFKKHARISVQLLITCREDFFSEICLQLCLNQIK